jgi:hypothetical protein
MPDFSSAVLICKFYQPGTCDLTASHASHGPSAYIRVNEVSSIDQLPTLNSSNLNPFLQTTYLNMPPSPPSPLPLKVPVPFSNCGDKTVQVKIPAAHLDFGLHPRSIVTFALNFGETYKITVKGDRIVKNIRYELFQRSRCYLFQWV